MGRRVKNQTNHIEGVGVGMKVINKVKERIQSEEVKAAEQNRIRREEKLRIAQVEESIIDFYLDRRAWGEFLDTMKNSGLIRTYGHEGLGGAFYINQQIEAAHRFFELSIRDRSMIKELIVEEYRDHYQNIKLNLVPNKEVLTQLKNEARELGLDSITYLRAIFYTRAFDINQAQRKLNEEQKAEQFDSRTVEIKGYINKDIRKKLEAKYGKPKWNSKFNIPIETYFDLLLRAANEGLEK